MLRHIVVLLASHPGAVQTESYIWTAPVWPPDSSSLNAKAFSISKPPFVDSPFAMFNHSLFVQRACYAWLVGSSTATWHAARC